MNIDEILDFIDKNVIKSGLNSAAGNYAAYVPGHGIFSTVLADYLIAVIIFLILWKIIIDYYRFLINFLEW